MLAAFACANAIGNLWRICLGHSVNIMSLVSCDNFNGNIPQLKGLRVTRQPS